MNVSIICKFIEGNIGNLFTKEMVLGFFGETQIYKAVN